jgi:flagellar assembly factor FliW
MSPIQQGAGMTVTLQSTRFGTLEIDDAAVIEFPEGLIGLGGHRYTLVSHQPNSPFVWLQSIDDPELALPVTNPHLFFADFALAVPDDVAAHVGLDADTTVDVYVTVRTADDPADFAANLRAPIIVRDGRGHQVLNEAPGCELRAPLFRAGSAAASAA